MAVKSLLCSLRLLPVDIICIHLMYCVWRCRESFVGGVVTCTAKLWLRMCPCAEVGRHAARVIFLEYVGEGPIDTTLMLVGKVCLGQKLMRYSVILKYFFKMYFKCLYCWCWLRVERHTSCKISSYEVEMHRLLACNYYRPIIGWFANKRVSAGCQFT